MGQHQLGDVEPSPVLASEGRGGAEQSTAEESLGCEDAGLHRRVPVLHLRVFSVRGDWQWQAFLPVTGGHLCVGA